MQILIKKGDNGLFSKDKRNLSNLQYLSSIIFSKEPFESSNRPNLCSLSKMSNFVLKKIGYLITFAIVSGQLY